MDNDSICNMKPWNPLIMAQTWKFFHSHFSWCQTVKSDTGQHSQFLRCLGHPFWSVLYDPNCHFLFEHIWVRKENVNLENGTIVQFCFCIILIMISTSGLWLIKWYLSGNLTNMSIWNKLHSTRFSAKFMTCTNLDKAGGQIVKYKYVCVCRGWTFITRMVQLNWSYY